MRNSSCIILHWFVYEVYTIKHMAKSACVSSLWKHYTGLQWLLLLNIQYSDDSCQVDIKQNPLLGKSM